MYPENLPGRNLVTPETGRHPQPLQQCAGERHTHTHTHTHTYTHTHHTTHSANTHTHTHTHTRINRHTQAAHSLTNTLTHSDSYIPTYICMAIDTQLYTPCAHISIYMAQILTHKRTHTHTFTYRKTHTHTHTHTRTPLRADS